MKRKVATKKASPMKKAKSSPSKAKPVGKSKLSVELKAYPSEGWKVALTGEFEKTTHKELQDELKGRGVKIAASVTKTTTHLIVGRKEPTKKRKAKEDKVTAKEAKAEELNTPIITETQLWELINNQDVDIAATSDGDAKETGLFEEEEVDEA